MDHDLSAKLPPPHEEEPAQLRSDILDELRDHLNCATERERRRLQLSGEPADAVTVWQLVIERFGDPSALARRLWLDAMKGRLMTQRVMLGAVAVGLIALVGWMAVLSRSLTEVINENQKATALILERMEKETPAQAPRQPSEFAAVRFTLVQKTPDGLPVIGQVVHFDQHPGEEALRLGDLSETTDLHGVADFGNLPFGIYDLTIESIGGTFKEQVTLRPERPIDLRIVVPEAPGNGQVKIDFAPPDWAMWDWVTEDHKPPAGEPVLLIRYRGGFKVELDNRTWNGPEETNTVAVRTDGIYPVIPEDKEQHHALAQQFGSDDRSDNDDRLIDGTSRLDRLSLPRGPLTLTAEWFYRVENADGVGEGQILIRPVFRWLNPDYARSLKPTQKLDRFKFPLILDIDSSVTQPQVIHIPSNDPSTFDGESLPPLIPLRGGGGGGGFF